MNMILCPFSLLSAHRHALPVPTLNIPIYSVSQGLGQADMDVLTFERLKVYWERYTNRLIIYLILFFLTFIYF